jgi:hypothetical protein
MGFQLRCRVRKCHIRLHYREGYGGVPIWTGEVTELHWTPHLITAAHDSPRGVYYQVLEASNLERSHGW